MRRRSLRRQEPMASEDRSPSPPTTGRYLRHRLRQQVSEWAKIGASGRVLAWIRHGVAIQ
eukprot:852123-Pyramimonas_sp.AAC.1